MSHNTDNKLECASISWHSNQPFSEAYDDVYYSKENGLNESEYVFYHANQLDNRFIDEHCSRPLVIFETGFGTGLNFLVTWSLWDQLPSKNRRPLHFISIEKHPLKREDLLAALKSWPSLEKYAGKLVDNYPYLVKGPHQISFPEDNVTLTLIFGDVNDDLDKYFFGVDCWYLDGFAPSKNPEMWSDTLFTFMRNHSRPGATFSTFTAASFVRKGLSSHVFCVNKQKGFGNKREMLTGCFNEAPDFPKLAHERHHAKWSLSDTFVSDSNFAQKPLGDETNKKTDFDAIIVGGGLAGLSTAHALINKGLTVAVIEARDSLMAGASGQDQLVMYAKLPTEYNKTYRFIEHSLCHSLRFYKQFQARSQSVKFWHQTGLLQIGWNEKERLKQEKFTQNITLPENLITPINSIEAAKKTGIGLRNGGLWFNDAGWLQPLLYLEAITHTCKGSFNYFVNERVEKFQQDTSKNWQVKITSKTLSSRYLIICNSNDAKSHTEFEHLPIKPLRGQVTSIKSPKLQPAKAVVCGEGYLCPPMDNWHHFGATFDLDKHEEKTYSEDNNKNIENLCNWLPEWGYSEHETIKAKAGLRCTTPDYFPIVGLAPKFESMITRFERLRVGANTCNQFFGDYHDNLFINVGHGSKGLFTTPLAADLIAAMITDTPIPMTEEMRVMLSPSRFIIKHLKQRRI